MGLVLLLVMVGVPIVEIAVFIEVGGRLGLWPTLATVILTAMAGTALLRQQGLATLQRVHESLEANRFPMAEVFDGLCLLVAGALLLTPGFVTDAAGLLLFVPAVRGALRRAFGRGFGGGGGLGLGPGLRLLFLWCASHDPVPFGGVVGGYHGSDGRTTVSGAAGAISTRPNGRWRLVGVVAVILRRNLVIFAVDDGAAAAGGDRSRFFCPRV